MAGLGIQNAIDNTALKIVGATTAREALDTEKDTNTEIKLQGIKKELSDVNNNLKEEDLKLKGLKDTQNESNYDLYPEIVKNKIKEWRDTPGHNADNFPNIDFKNIKQSEFDKLLKQKESVAEGNFKQAAYDIAGNDIYYKGESNQTYQKELEKAIIAKQELQSKQQLKSQLKFEMRKGRQRVKEGKAQKALLEQQLKDLQGGNE